MLYMFYMDDSSKVFTVSTLTYSRTVNSPWTYFYQIEIVIWMFLGELTLLRPVQSGVPGCCQGWWVSIKLQVSSSWSREIGQDYREGLCLGNTKAIPPAAEAVHRSVKMPQGETWDNLIALIGYSILLLNVIIFTSKERRDKAQLPPVPR